MRGALLQVRVPWQSNNISEQLLEHRIVRVTAVWPRITHLEGEAQELFFCMGRRMGENQETKLEMKDHLSFAILGTRVGVSVALELDASLAKCAGRQNDPTGSPAHPWRRCVTVTRSSAGCLYSNTARGDSVSVGFSHGEKESFSLPFSALLPLWRKPIILL